MLANGNVYSASKAAEVLTDTRAAGLMIGRGAIRNPGSSIKSAIVGRRNSIHARRP